jgi:hypothetical protein
MTDPTECWLRRWTIPIEPDVAAEVLLPWPMTPERWNQFWSVLEAMKPGLSAGDPAADPGAGTR